MTDTLASPVFPGARVSMFIGKPGWGKTYRALERWWTWNRAVAIDTKNPMKDVPPDFPGLIAWNPRELGELLSRHSGDERFRIVYRGQMEFIIDGKKTVEPIFNALVDLRDVLLTVDETDKWTTANYTPDGLYSFVHHGRTLGQAVSLCARRPTNLARDLTSSAEEIWAWPLDEPLDRKYLLDRGFDLDVLDRLGDHSEHAALVKRIPPGRNASYSIVI